MKKIQLHSSLLLLPIILLYLFLSQQLFLKDPAVWPDEPYFSNIAQNTIYSGVPFLDLYGTSGIGSPHTQALSYPPLYNFILAIWFRVFGAGIVSLRLLSFVAGLLCIIVFFKIVKITANLKSAFILSLLFLFFPPFGSATRVGRMEGLVLLFSLISLRLVVSKLTTKTSLLSGMFSAFSLLLHPIGIFSVFAPLLIIAISKTKLKSKIRLIYAYFAPLLLGLLWWIYSVSGHLDLFLTQMQLQFGYKSTREALLNLLFQNDPLWRITLLLMLFIGGYGLCLAYIKKHKQLAVYAVSIFLTFFLVLNGKEQWYLPFIIVYPLLTLSLTIAIAKRTRLILSFCMFIFFLLFSYQTFGNFLYQSRKNTNYFPFANAISKELPINARVALSVIPDPYFVLKKRPDIRIYQVPHVTTAMGFKALMDQVDYVVYNFATNEYLLNFLKSNQKSKVTVLQPNGYEAEVIKIR